MHSVRLHILAVTAFDDAWRWQLETAEGVRKGAPEALALLQHEPVYTLGRNLHPEYLLETPEALRARGVSIVETNRGGDVTFHGPGQIVGYPILDLRRRGLGPTEYVRLLEETLIRTLERFGVDAWRSPGRPGVWTRLGKVAAIGVRFERGVSLHGFALNVDVDLSWFDAIVPCGLADASVTSMARLADKLPTMNAVTATVAEEFANVFQVTLEKPCLSSAE